MAINFERLPDGNIRANSEEYVLITPGFTGMIDIDGHFTIAEFEQILETAKAATTNHEQPQSTVATDTPLPGFVSLG